MGTFVALSFPAVQEMAAPADGARAKLNSIPSSTFFIVANPIGPATRLAHTRALFDVTAGEQIAMPKIFNAPGRSRTCNPRFRRSIFRRDLRAPEGQEHSGFSASNWLSLGFAGFTYFTRFSFFFHRFSGKSDIRASSFVSCGPVVLSEGML